MQNLITAAITLSLLIVVKPHPICNQTTDQHNTATSELACNTNLTASLAFLNDWLSLHDESKGIDQLRSRIDSSIASILLNLTTTLVILL